LRSNRGTNTPLPVSESPARARGGSSVKPKIDGWLPRRAFQATPACSYPLANFAASVKSSLRLEVDIPSYSLPSR
jgi:hypothetical protein